MMETTLDELFACYEGRNDRVRGKKFQDCPYGTPNLVSAWQDGWETADDSLREMGSHV